MSTTGLMAPIEIDGLRALQKALKELDGDSQKMLRPALNDAAQIIVDTARPWIPVATGAARASLRVSSGQRTASVTAGGRRAPYFPWLDYGGRTGRGGSIARPFIRGGRYIYPAYERRHGEIMAALDKRIRDLIEAKGLHVT